MPFHGLGNTSLVFNLLAFMLHIYWIYYSFTYSGTLMLFLSVSTFGLIIYIQSKLINYVQRLLGICQSKSIIAQIKHLIVARIVVSLLLFRPYRLLFQYLTRHFRQYPDVYILGERKCGTTTMAEYLRLLGCIGPTVPFEHAITRNKESHFWQYQYASIDLYRLNWPIKFSNIYNWVFSKINSHNRHISDDDQISRFRSRVSCTQPDHDDDNIHDEIEKKRGKRCKRKGLCFDATPAWLGLPYCRDYIHSIQKQFKPNTKFIIMLRNPVSRFKSAMQQHVMLSRQFYQHIGCEWVEQGVDFEGKNACQNVINFGLSQKRAQLYEKMKNEIKIENNFLPKWVQILDRFSMFNHGCFVNHIEYYLEKFDKKQFLFVEINQLKPQNLENTLDKVCTFLEIEKPNSWSDIVDADIKANKSRSDIKQFIEQNLWSEDISKQLKRLYKPYNERLYKLVGKDYGWD